MTRLRPSHVAVLIASVSLVSTAHAAVLEFTDAPSYNAASYPIGGGQFDGLVDPSGLVQITNPTLPVAGVSFSAPSANFYLVGPNYAPGFNFPGDGTATLYAQQGATDVGVTLKADFAGAGWPVTAAGTQIGGFGLPETMSVVVTTNHATYNFTYNAPDAQTGLGFLGFVSTTPGETISWVSYSAPQTGNATQLASVIVDNFTYGTVNPAGVPEPASLGILAIGALAVGTRRRALGRR